MCQFIAPVLEGVSAHLVELRSKIEKVALVDFPVLIEGETGTGKELVARQIHARSPRNNGPFVAVNCSALVESLLDSELFGIERGAATDVVARAGRFERAHRGTLFLDEVADLSPAAQAKLLRVLQDFRVERVGGTPRAVDVRVVAATNQPLRPLIESSRFRSDLFYRLGGLELAVLPLRSRIEDIVPLALSFLRVSAGRSIEINSRARAALIEYEWPGNVRELQRMMEHAFVFMKQGELGIDDLPLVLRKETDEQFRGEKSLDSWASQRARVVYEQAGRNKKMTCAILGISYTTLNRRLADRKALHG